MTKALAAYVLSGLAIMAIIPGLIGCSAAEAGTPESRPWSFGVMSDTQWTSATDPSGENPNGVSVSIIDQLNREFIDKRVKFVIQVGDLTENGNNADETVRADAAEPLYKAGIGFFPMRGNHETYASPANSFAIPVFQSLYPQTRGLSNTFGAGNFSSPTSVSADLNGMTYSFDFNNARFVILDDWATTSQNVTAAGYNYGYSISQQQPWIDSRLQNRTPQHAFVFSHQNLIGENHQDTLFNGYTNANPAMQNAFLSSLESNKVEYYVSGHDHVHQRSLIASPDGQSSVQEIICASDSSKFYTPKSVTDANWFGQKARETSVSQDLFTIGYYIYTVDGPRVTVDYYGDDHGNWKSDNNYPGSEPNQVTQTLNFVKKESWGYSLNGKEFLVGGAHSTSYTAVQDSYQSTTARILSGTYSNSETDYTSRVLTQTVDTGWTAKDDGRLSSDILTLWGMDSAGAERNSQGILKTDTYVLSMTYDGQKNPQANNGRFGLATKDSKGNWTNAVNLNFGGSEQFVAGPWNSSYGLGTYGVDPVTKTAWAVIDYDSSFAVATGIQTPKDHRN
jgi:hypothetical protein